MFGAKKKDQKRDHSGRDLSQYGLFDMSANFDMNGGLNQDDNGEDSDFEAELAALAGGGGARPKKPPRRKVPDADLDAMVAESMKDLPSDEEISGDEMDPDLLNELQDLTGDVEEQETHSVQEPAEQSNDLGSILNARLKMYEEAEKNAKASGETSRARRFGRGLKTIKELIKQENSGKSINPDDIPPEVAVSIRKPVEPVTESTSMSVSQPEPTPTRPAPPVPQKSLETEIPDSPTHQVDVQLVEMLKSRQKQYKIAALKAKKSGDNETAISYVRIAKQFDIVIKAAENGQEVDLSKMPSPPPDHQQTEQHLEENKIQKAGDDLPTIEIPEGDVGEEENLITASSVAEALEQRLEVYKKQEETAKEQGNASKARRMGRIVKQYEQAIKANKLGKPIQVDELPTPPGFGPIPVEGAAASAAAPSPSPAASSRKPPSLSPSSSQEKKSKVGGSEPTTTRISGNQVPNSRADKQLALLLAKQKQFKEAALHAKRKGEIDQAKEFLRTAKGFEPLIEAANCGLPVDLSTLPVSPTAKSQLDNEYEIIMNEECTEGDSSNMDIITRLEMQLTKQLKMCLSTRDHHKALGDVAGMNRFERLALNVTKDLDLVRLAHRTPSAGAPKYHYENKEFSIVKSFTELGDNDLEVTVVRGISYTCSNPKDVDTYVKFDFPFPQDEPYSQRTATTKNTNNPEYNATYTIPIQRTSRACQRVFKRQSVKFEVYSKGCWCASDLFCCFSGFFRGDTLLGTATVKLQPLETQCELHESFDLLEGRKKVGGKLEVKLCLRHPIVSQEVEQIREKWLVVDS